MTRKREVGAHRAPYRRDLFHNLERGALTMPRSRAGEQCANGVNRLAVPANNPAHVASPKLQSEKRRFAARNFREHHLIGIFDQLPNDELEKFSH